MHLYVLQNEHGLLKVGRAADVERRRRQLERTDACRIATVIVVPDQGHSEEAVHTALSDHRMSGEWFDGTEEARAAVVRAVGWIGAVEWPHSRADGRAVQSWIDLIEERRAVRMAEQELRRILVIVADEPGDVCAERFLEGRIWNYLWRFEQGEAAGVDYAVNGNGPMIAIGYRPGGDQGEPVPHYLRDPDAANSLWPEDKRPAGWTGTARECCLAALWARSRASR